MSLDIGIVGLPNVGKSTLFKCITSAQAEAANYPFCTIEPNIGIVEIPDLRFKRLSEIYKPEKIISNTLRMVDIAGLVEGAASGEGLGNKFLDNIRQTDVIAHLVRCFENDDIIHVKGRINPAEDIKIINNELLLADLEVVEKKIERLGKIKGDKTAIPVLEDLRNLRDLIEGGKFASEFEPKETNLTPPHLREMNLITAKPILFVLNVSEEKINETDDYQQAVTEIAKNQGAGSVKICCSMESEISDMAADEREDFLREMGIPETGLSSIIRNGFQLMDRISFFTCGKKEVRAWDVRKGAKAPEAAGKIHSDMERGFIRAEVYHFDDVDRLSSEAAVKEAGKLRVEGKDYEVKDGDIMHIRFNV